MALARRYMPSWPPGESDWIGMDFSPIIPPGQIITSAELEIVRNTNPVTDATADFAYYVNVPEGRQIWAFLSGGVEATDYQLRWTVADNGQRVWHRTALLLCAESS